MPAPVSFIFAVRIECPHCHVEQINRHSVEWRERDIEAAKSEGVITEIPELPSVYRMDCWSCGESFPLPVGSLPKQPD